MMPSEMTVSIQLPTDPRILSKFSGHGGLGNADGLIAR